MPIVAPEDKQNGCQYW